MALTVTTRFVSFVEAQTTTICVLIDLKIDISAVVTFYRMASIRSKLIRFLAMSLIHIYYQTCTALLQVSKSFIHLLRLQNWIDHGKNY